VCVFQHEVPSVAWCRCCWPCVPQCSCDARTLAHDQSNTSHLSVAQSIAVGIKSVRRQLWVSSISTLGNISLLHHWEYILLTPGSMTESWTPVGWGAVNPDLNRVPAAYEAHDEREGTIILLNFRIVQARQPQRSRLAACLGGS
jgi:hypothetical protein